MLTGAFGFALVLEAEDPKYFQVGAVADGDSHVYVMVILRPALVKGRFG